MVDDYKRKVRKNDTCTSDMDMLTTQPNVHNASQLVSGSPPEIYYKNNIKKNIINNNVHIVNVKIPTKHLYCICAHIYMTKPTYWYFSVNPYIWQCYWSVAHLDGE